MPRNPEIDRLKGASDQAFNAKQVAYYRMKPLGQRRHDLKDQMDASWDRVQAARSEMNSAYERQQSEWEAYRRERDSISAQIDDVARDADRAHENMKDAFQRASDAYEYGDKASAPYYSQEGKDYRYERDGYNDEKRRLIDIAKSMTPPRSGFHYYKDQYNSLMESHKSLQAEYQVVKQQHETARDEFDRAKERFEQARAAFDHSITEERAKWRDERCASCSKTFRVHADWSHPPKYCPDCREEYKNNKEKALRKVNGQVGYINGDKAKVVQRKDGKTDVYFGGLVDADGLGHGHIVVNDVSAEYVRQPWQDKKDADIDDRRKDHTRI